MLTIQKIVLHNFKRFRDLEMDVNPELNILIGDNESGKSSILQAIDLVARGSRTRVENIGLDRLFNEQTVATFLSGSKSINDLPEMFVELYFANQADPSLVGEANSKHQNCSGIRMYCSFDSKYGKTVCELYAKNPQAPFPFEFYTVNFETFSGEPFVAHTKKMRSMLLDNSQINSPIAMRDYVNAIYRATLSDQDRYIAKLAYRESKKRFEDTTLAAYNTSIAPQRFAVRDDMDDNLDTDITILEDGVPLENKGAGTQCFVKTQLSLTRKTGDVDVVLIEEPENHLSYMKTLELIRLIQTAQNKQLFISTHSDLIATRLDLRQCHLLNSASTAVVSLKDLAKDTAKFFIKAPDNNMLQFILSKKSILVEGDAEFILMDAMCKQTLGKDLSDIGVGVIAVDGKCFKRYLEIAKILNNKVAVITDNDGNYMVHVTENYSEYTDNQHTNIAIFSDTDAAKYTFEVCVYSDNKQLCDAEFQTPKRKLSTEDYMLSNKAEAAYALMRNRADSIVVPEYIQNALRWIDA